MDFPDDALIRLEIQADRNILDPETRIDIGDRNIYENYKTENPYLYIYNAANARESMFLFSFKKLLRFCFAHFSIINSSGSSPGNFDGERPSAKII